MTFRDLALAAHSASLKAAADRATAARTDAIAAARLALTPVLSDGAKVLLDPKLLRADWVSPDLATVVLTTPDDLSFAVRGGVVELVKGSGADWTTGPRVGSAADVGRVLAGG